MSENLRAPFIVVRQIPPEQIERGLRLQRDLEAIDALEAKKLADDLRADEEVRVEQERVAVIEETRRAASVSGKLMDARYGWVGRMKR